MVGNKYMRSANVQKMGSSQQIQKKKHRINLTLNLSIPKQYGLPVRITANVFGKH